MRVKMMLLAVFVAAGAVGGVVVPAQAGADSVVPAHGQFIPQPDQVEDDDNDADVAPTVRKVALAPGYYCGSYIRQHHSDAAVLDSSGNGLIDNAMYRVQRDGTVSFENDCNNCVMEQALSQRKTLHPRCNY
ncbi:hypothetical protein ACFYO1_01175 [Nocardia sp. NPDC006044]|uniref:hypothetical protein n=1 Tax=Nocardia sp. NPDC006044 TaxID=3364306 RepID=UPI0036A09B60